ncbi:MAG: GAF domain-containing protein [Acidobacteria bacterium]|nr:GAF domain-containing protein [Candidatus Sulfomarinibacter kjeldsenii]
MDSFDRNWRGLQLETLVDLSLTIGGVLSEEELVDELLQRSVGTLDAGSGFVSSLHPGGQEAIVRSVGLPQSVEVVRSFFDPHLLEDLAAGLVVHAQRTSEEPPFELMAAPMLWQQRTVGMVVLADKEIREGRATFSEGDARLLLSMASSASHLQ